ncbi:MAG: formate dehydrogenase accessory sulfurtransferase FdhD [Gammaproteobacteria bacterium]|nr:formate dehydrogenase accessory sulfurtransferase FdhD [Gammaproteobacteria bacterium]
MSAVHARPVLSSSGLPPTHAVTATDEHGATRTLDVADERPLTIYVDKREIVTLMTLGTQPEALTLGYLRNQGLVTELSNIASVQVDWDVNAVAVTTVSGEMTNADRLERRTVTTGCGQGTIFGDVMADLDGLTLTPPGLSRDAIYSLLKTLATYNDVYRSAGAVHGCALCAGEAVRYFIEDVGRHNAVDAIAGHMWLDGESGEDKVFYTTGRLTSEMVIKVAQMRIPVLLSRSGITRMGLDIARQVGVVMVARAKGRHFLVYHGSEHVTGLEQDAAGSAS